MSDDNILAELSRAEAAANALRVKQEEHEIRDNQMFDFCWRDVLTEIEYERFLEKESYRRMYDTPLRQSSLLWFRAQEKAMRKREKSKGYDGAQAMRKVVDLFMNEVVFKDGARVYSLEYHLALLKTTPSVVHAMLKELFPRLAADMARNKAKWPSDQAVYPVNNVTKFMTALSNILLHRSSPHLVRISDKLSSCYVTWAAQNYLSDCTNLYQVSCLWKETGLKTQLDILKELLRLLDGGKTIRAQSGESSRSSAKTVQNLGKARETINEELARKQTLLAAIRKVEVERDLTFHAEAQEEIDKQGEKMGRTFGSGRYGYVPPGYAAREELKFFVEVCRYKGSTDVPGGEDYIKHLMRKEVHGLPLTEAVCLEWWDKHQADSAEARQLKELAETGEEE